MVAGRAAAVPARLPWQLLGDPTHAMLGFDAVGVAAIHLDPHGVVCAVNRTWQQAGTDGLYCVLTVGRDIGAAAAVIGPATARLVRLVATAATGVTEQLELAVPGPRGRVTRRYRLSAGAAGAPLGGVISPASRSARPAMRGPASRTPPCTTG